MTGEQPRNGPGVPAAGRPPVNVLAPSAGQPAADAEGGEAACWANRVCEECGTVQGEHHREGCSLATPPGAERSDPPSAP